MPKDFSLPNLLRDLDYTVNGTYVHEFLFRVCPPREGLKVCEAGSGSGKFGLSYALHGAQVTLIEIDPEVVEYSHRIKLALVALLRRALLVEVIAGDLFRWLPKLGGYDLVFNEGVPQHWPDEEKRQRCIDLMAEVSRGMVVIIGNNGHNPREQEIDRTFQFTYEGMPPTRKCFTREELQDRMVKAGLKDVQVAPLGGLQGDIPWTESTLMAGWGRKQ